MEHLKDRFGTKLRQAGIGAALLPPLVTGLASTGRAQGVPLMFPTGVSGYEQELGVTVLSREHPLYEPQGIHLGGFTLSPQLSQALQYNSNVTGQPDSGSFISSTTGSVSAASNWSRNSLGASLGFDRQDFLAFPSNDYTDWNVGLAGGYTIGDGGLSAAYSHQSYHQIGISIGTVDSETPVLDQVDTARVGYTLNLNRLAITPELSATSYRFGTATVLGTALNQNFLNSNIFSGGITAHYSMSDAGGVSLVIRDISADYTSPQPGQPTNDFNSLLLLAGLDYQPKGVWRYSFMAGLEIRSFRASQYPTRAAPFVEAGAIWTPTGLTTLSMSLAHIIENPQSGGTNGYVLSQARIVMDQEYQRNIILELRGNFEYAQYLQGGGGSEKSYGIGTGVTWLINRHMWLSLNYDLSKQTGSISTMVPASPLNLTAFTSTSYSDSVIALTLHLAL